MVNTKYYSVCQRQSTTTCTCSCISHQEIKEWVAHCCCIHPAWEKILQSLLRKNSKMTTYVCSTIIKYYSIWYTWYTIVIIYTACTSSSYGTLLKLIKYRSIKYIKHCSEEEYMYECITLRVQHKKVCLHSREASEKHTETNKPAAANLLVKATEWTEPDYERHPTTTVVNTCTTVCTIILL